MSNSTAYHTFFAIPELVHLLAKVASTKTLSNCVLVNSSWHKFFLPYLWSNFSENGYRWVSDIKYIIYHTPPKDTAYLEQFYCVYKKRLSLIQHLELNLPLILDILVPNNCSTNRGEEGTREEENEEEEEEEGDVSVEGQSMEYTHNIKSLDIRFNCHQLNGLHYTRKKPEVIIEQCLRLIQHSNLKYLAIRECMELSDRINEGCLRLSEILRDRLIPLFNSFSTITHLHVTFKDGISLLPPNIQFLEASFKRNAYELELYPSFVACETLTELRLVSPINSTVLPTLLESYPKLKRLIIDGFKGSNERYYLDERELARSSSDSPVQQYPMQYMHFDKNVYKNYKMNFSPTIFRFLASLVEFHHNTLTREMSIQIGYTCHLLEVLSIIPLFGSTCRVQKRSVTVDTVTPILTSCPRLRIFDGDFLELHASNVPEHPWVCTKLQVLKCQIVGIQYLASGDEKELDELGPDTEVTNKWLEACLNQLKSITSLKRSIFKKISELTFLNVLSISPDHKNATDEVLSTYISKRDDKLYYKYPDPHRDTLSMKLSDGLDQLGTLTRLEYLGFECVRHRMEKEEIEWIAANLPSLKEMRGLADDIHIGLELDPKKKQLRELMETLRKDIIHTQSFTKDMVFFRE